MEDSTWASTVSALYEIKQFDFQFLLTELLNISDFIHHRLARISTPHEYHFPELLFISQCF
jgi:hypothetical protein